jgi:hypothetical protein
VDDSSGCVSAAGRGRAINENDSRIHKAASMSAALSEVALDQEYCHL